MLLVLDVFTSCQVDPATHLQNELLLRREICAALSYAV
jgi:hypothetical protein